jgi:hypothetical protein
MTPTRDIIGEFKALRLHGMAATWADLCEQNSGEVQGTRWLIEPLLRAELTDPERWLRWPEHRTGFDKWSSAGLTWFRVVHGGGRASLATNARPTRWATRVHRSCCLFDSRQRREVELVGSLLVERRMRARGVVEIDVPLEPRLGMDDRVVGVQIHLFVLDRSP